MFIENTSVWLIVSCSRFLFYYVQLTRACRVSISANSFQLYFNLIYKCLLTLVRIARKMPAITHDFIFCLASYNFAWFCHFNTTNLTIFSSEQWVYDLICTQARGITNIANGAISISNASFFQWTQKNVFQNISLFVRKIRTTFSLLHSLQNRCKLETHSIKFQKHILHV